MTPAISHTVSDIHQVCNYTVRVTFLCKIITMHITMKIYPVPSPIPDKSRRSTPAHIFSRRW